jgi:hypothetical protein
MAERSGKTVYPKMGIWCEEGAGDIRLSIPCQGLSCINGNADSRGCNPHFFNKLAKVLRGEGWPNPAILENWKNR